MCLSIVASGQWLVLVDASAFSSHSPLVTSHSLPSLHKRRVLLRRVDAVRGAGDFRHVNGAAVLQGTELLEFFRLLQRAGLPGGEVLQELPAVRVHAQM